MARKKTPTADPARKKDPAPFPQPAPRDRVCILAVNAAMHMVRATFRPTRKNTLNGHLADHMLAAAYHLEAAKLLKDTGRELDMETYRARASKCAGAMAERSPLLTLIRLDLDPYEVLPRVIVGDAKSKTGA